MRDGGYPDTCTLTTVNIAIILSRGSTLMEPGKLYKFKICRQEAVFLNGRIEVSVPDEDVGSKILMKLSSALLNKKIISLRLNMPNKIVFVTARDAEHIVMRAEESNDKQVLN